MFPPLLLLQQTAPVADAVTKEEKRKLTLSLDSAIAEERGGERRPLSAFSNLSGAWKGMKFNLRKEMVDGREKGESHSKCEFSIPDGTFKLMSATHLRKKNVMFMLYFNDMFHYMLKAEFVTLVSLKAPTGLLNL